MQMQSTFSSFLAEEVMRSYSVSLTLGGGAAIPSAVKQVIYDAIDKFESENKGRFNWLDKKR